MAGSPEGDNRGFAERFAEGFRNVGIVVALLGVIAILANPRIGWPVFVAGVSTAVIGEVGRRTGGSGKK